MSDVCTCAVTSKTRNPATCRPVCDDHCYNRLLRVECIGGGEGGPAAMTAPSFSFAATLTQSGSGGAGSAASGSAADVTRTEARTTSGSSSKADDVSVTRTICSIGPGCGNRAIKEGVQPSLIPRPVSAGLYNPRGATHHCLCVRCLSIIKAHLLNNKSLFLSDADPRQGVGCVCGCPHLRWFLHHRVCGRDHRRGHAGETYVMYLFSQPNH